MEVLLALDCGYCGSPDVSEWCPDCCAVPYCSSKCRKKDWHKRHEREHTEDMIDPVKHSDNAEHYESVTSHDDPEHIVFGLKPEIRDYFIGKRMARKRGGRAKGRRGKRWVQRALKHPGAFTRQAKKRGMTTRAFMHKVLSNPKEYSTHTVRQANFMKTLLHLHHSR